MSLCIPYLSLFLSLIDIKAYMSTTLLIYLYSLSLSFYFSWAYSLLLYIMVYFRHFLNIYYIYLVDSISLSLYLSCISELAFLLFVYLSLNYRAYIITLAFLTNCACQKLIIGPLVWLVCLLHRNNTLSFIDKNFHFQRKCFSCARLVLKLTLKRTHGLWKILRPL